MKNIEKVRSGERQKSKKTQLKDTGESEEYRKIQRSRERKKQQYINLANDFMNGKKIVRHNSMTKCWKYMRKPSQFHSTIDTRTLIDGMKMKFEK